MVAERNERGTKKGADPDDCFFRILSFLPAICLHACFPVRRLDGPYPFMPGLFPPSGREAGAWRIIGPTLPPVLSNTR
jgi:hypothetical protein